jgi:carnitine 3-dehydrogenase
MFEGGPQSRGQNMAKSAKTSSAHVAVVGTGVIGASWAACFLAKGFDVIATDPAEGAEARLRSLVSDFWPTLERIGLAPDASPARLKFDSNLTSTVAGAVFIQENGPERVDIKRVLIARIDAAAPTTTLIATSSSGILISEIQNAAARHPERVLVGHPFNPAAPDSPGRGGGRTCDLGGRD